MKPPYMLLQFLLLSLLPCVCLAQQGSNNYTRTFSICSDSAVTVTAMDITCDSSGTFYYGSGGYRNSEYCQPGDKASLVVYFDIVEQFLDSDVTVTITCTAPSGSDNAEVYKGASLCYETSLSSINGTACPSVGTYMIKTSFTYSSDDYYSNAYTDDNLNNNFVPTVMVGFASSDSNGEFDLGGANTYNCDNGSEEVTTVFIGKDGEPTPFVKFLACVGVLLGTVGFLGLFTWYIFVKRRSPGSECLLDDECMDDDTARSKAILMGKTKGLVYF